MARDAAYHQAEIRIEEAWRLGEKELDLSEIQLTELPDILGNLVQLQVLNLSENLLATLPESLGNLKRLRVLNLFANRLRELPETFANLTELEVIRLDQNQLITLPDWFGKFSKLKSLSLAINTLKSLPDQLSQVVQLEKLDLSVNKLEYLPDSFTQLTKLRCLSISENRFKVMPNCIQHLENLEEFYAIANQIMELPNAICNLRQLNTLILGGDKLSDYWHYEKSMKKNGNKLTSLPFCIAELPNLKELDLRGNPLNPELAAANKQGLEAVKAYLRAKAEGGQIILNEAKLILVGEGEVGKTCLLGALRDEPFVAGLSSTHGIDIKPVKLTDPDTHTEITLNGWDFGGQRVYRPTHQLFFSAPAVYLVVWKPREGPQQGFVKDWIKLIKHREPDAKILVVATHGGPQQRQPDIDRQELWDLFGRQTVVDFFFVDSKPNAQGKRKGIDELKHAIARLAAALPEVGRSVPKSFADARAALQTRNLPYLPLDEVLALCRAHHMDDEIARLFLNISHRLGHLTHYQHDPALRDIVILRPDWLATAMSYVLDDEATRAAHGLVRFSYLAHLWDDVNRPADTRYPAALHRIFLNLMGRFDLSYPVAELVPLGKGDPMGRPYDDPLSLISQFVPDNRPKNFDASWREAPALGDLQQTQICRIVDEKGNSAAAEGLFYQLIVRLHKYSLGRAAYPDSVHWQRGLVLDDDYNGLALLEHKGNDVHITVRAPYPERFLAMLTEEVKYLVESFWEGLRCDVMVPCLNETPCIGLFEVRKLIENKKRARPEQPCPVCNEWQNIDELLNNAPAASQPVSLDTLLKEFAQVKDTLSAVNDNTKRILSQVDKQYADLIQIFTDEAKEGPRLFSLFPLEGNRFNPKSWVRHQFRLVLWCEHARLPLPAPTLNGPNSKKGVYDLQLEREWFSKAAPYLKLVASTLSLVLPVASSALKVVNDTAFQSLQDQIGLGKDVIDAIAGESAAFNDFMGKAESTDLARGVAVRADGGTLRELQSMLKAKDPSFGGLVRVLNKRNEFVWVHEKFAGEY